MEVQIQIVQWIPVKQIIWIIISQLIFSAQIIRIEIILFFQLNHKQIIIYSVNLRM